LSKNADAFYSSLPFPAGMAVFLKKSEIFNMQHVYSDVVKSIMHDISDFHKNRCRLRVAVFTFVILAAAVCFLAVPVMAHAPTAMRFSFVPSNNLSVTITHPVDNPATHYVKNIQVRLNDKVIGDYVYTSQPAKDTFTYTYPITVQAGDMVSVAATCVQGGTLEESYVPIRKGTPVPTRSPLPARSSTAPSTIPPTTTRTAAAGFLPLFGAAAALLLLRKD
jgi:hypothetical protein